MEEKSAKNEYGVRLLSPVKFKKLNGVYLCIGKRLRENEIIALPMGAGQLFAKEVMSIYNDFSAFLTGRRATQCLTNFYTKNPVTGVWMLKDETLELQVAEMMGMDLHVCREGESSSDSIERMGVSSEKLCKDSRDLFVTDMSEYVDSGEWTDGWD